MRLINKYNIGLTANIIVGHPGETEDDLDATFDLIKKIRPIFVHLHNMTLYPGTRIYDKYKNKSEGVNHRNFDDWPLAKFDKKTIKKKIFNFYLFYYFSISYWKKYIKQRYQYLVWNLFSEMSFVIKSVCFLIIKR